MPSKGNIVMNGCIRCIINAFYLVATPGPTKDQKKKKEIGRTDISEK